MIRDYDIETNKNKIDELLLQELEEKTGRKTRGASTISLAFEEDGEYEGGILGDILFESCYVDMLAVKKTCRGKGIGKKLLHQLECELREKNIHTVFLNTQDYQAKDFYLKMGYELVGEIENIPFNGTTRYYFRKQI